MGGRHRRFVTNGAGRGPRNPPPVILTASRGLFRREYEGETLRENLGLRRPPNRFFEDAGRLAAQ